MPAVESVLRVESVSVVRRKRRRSAQESRQIHNGRFPRCGHKRCVFSVLFSAETTHSVTQRICDRIWG